MFDDDLAIPDSELDPENTEATEEKEEKESRRKYGLWLTLLALFLIPPIAGLLFIMGGFGDTADVPKPGNTEPPGTTEPNPGKTDVDIAVGEETIVRVDAKNVTFTPPMRAPGDTASAELEVTNTGNTEFFLTISALLLEHGADFAPYVNASLAVADSCDATPAENLYSGPADQLRVTMPMPLQPEHTAKLCMRTAVTFNTPGDYEGKTGQIGLSFTAAAQPAADGPGSTDENGTRETS